MIIASFNMGWCVGAAVDSALSQGVEGVEVIVVDDGSTDDTQTRLAPFAHRITLQRQQNSGQAAARNAALKLARGECIMFLDADDRLLPGKIALQLGYLRAHPAMSGVFSDGLLVTPEGEVLNRVSAESPAGLFSAEGAAQLRRHLLRGHPFPIHCALLRRSAVETVGGFDESLRAREDLDFWLRFAAAHETAYLPGELIEYVVRPRSVSRSRESMHVTGCLIYGALSRDAEFLALPAEERAAHLRAWAIEVGVQHHGPWAAGNEVARAFARTARQLDPHNWRGLLLMACLSMPAGIGLLQRGLAWQTRRWRNRHAKQASFKP